MSDLDRLDPKSGDPLLARDVKAIVDAVKRSLGRITGGNGIDVRTDHLGNTQITGVRRRASLAKANGAISALSGTTTGTGQADLYASLAGTVTALGATVDVLNGQGGIPSGQYCWLEQDDAGQWWVISGPPSLCWCVLGSSIAAGTYPPSGAPGGPLTGQTIYYISSGAYVALGGTYSVYNPRAATATSGKLAAVMPNGDGTYSVIDWDC